MADLDITERRHPQDGHISFTHEKKTYDLRIATMPTVAGEKVVVRILEKDADRFHLDRLGLNPAQRTVVADFVAHPYGMILVTGPTGSGKTTSLYAMLNHLNRPETNIITLEEPVENQIYGMNQIGIDPNFGMTFAAGLKYILRQDPDIVMVGEVRDRETAEIAVQAALTGHLLLTTLHTNDASGAVTRLVQLGVQPFLVSSALIGVVAQRLLRRVCPQCGEPWTAPGELLGEFGPHAERLATGQLMRGRGCDQCYGTGYRGRCGVFELLRITPEIGAMVERRASSVEIKAQAMRDGMTTLLDAGIERAVTGQTTIDEVRQRVLVWEKMDEDPTEQPVATG
jgi:type II secretory ATPase GspE/PulE/Tfp pilus assembly ATPase PilB-like protein